VIKAPSRPAIPSSITALPSYARRRGLKLGLLYRLNGAMHEAAAACCCFRGGRQTFELQAARENLWATSSAFAQRPEEAKAYQLQLCLEDGGVYTTRPSQQGPAHDKRKAAAKRRGCSTTDGRCKRAARSPSTTWASVRILIEVCIQAPESASDTAAQTYMPIRFVEQVRATATFRSLSYFARHH